MLERLSTSMASVLLNLPGGPAAGAVPDAENSANVVLVGVLLNNLSASNSTSFGLGNSDKKALRVFGENSAVKSDMLACAVLIKYNGG